MPQTTTTAANALPIQPISQDVLAEKYFAAGETSAEAVFARVSAALAAVEPTEELRTHWGRKFFKNMQAGAIGAGRIMAAAGLETKATLINCFVQPVADATNGFDEDGNPGIYTALSQAAETMRRGGGVGYDFSKLRPKGAAVKGTNSYASGPCSFIDVFDASCTTVESAGARRGAQMGVLRIDHPDVLEFIEAKRTKGRWNNFNVSVGVTDAFMQAVKQDAQWQLLHVAEPSEVQKSAGAHQASAAWVYSTISARALWDRIMQSAYDYAEPGILFLDNINTENNLWYAEDIAATNPCGEQPLPPYGCCDLGPIILTKFVRHPFDPEKAFFNFEAFEKAVATQVRLLDNVLDATVWPLPEQKREATNKRRIGVGFTGLGDALIMMGLRYDSDIARTRAAHIATRMCAAAYMASIDLAEEKGAFPLFDAERYLQSGFAKRLPAYIREGIRKHGIRNSHLLSIAPTGTVSLAFADNASNGIEPAYSWTYTRKKRMADGSEQFYTVEDHAYRLYKHMHGADAPLPDYFVSALDISAADHVAMMQAVQPYIDTAISKTVNIPADYPFEDFKTLYMDAWRAGLKGCATYRPNDTLGAVLSVQPPAPTAPVVPAVSAVIERRPAGQLPAVVEKIEYFTQDGARRLYLAVSFLPMPDGTERAIEFFLPVGQTGESQQWITTAMRSLSLAARAGFLSKALDDMRKVVWDRGPIRWGWIEKADGTRVPRWHDSEAALLAYVIGGIVQEREAARVAAAAPALQQLQQWQEAEAICARMDAMEQLANGKKCDECGAHAVIKKDGCSFCTACGHTGSCG